jgi:hypothetical protein
LSKSKSQSSSTLRDQHILGNNLSIRQYVFIDRRPELIIDVGSIESTSWTPAGNALISGILQIVKNGSFSKTRCTDVYNRQLSAHSLGTKMVPREIPDFDIRDVLI